MKDADCIAFLDWCLPRMDLRREGFRRVRKQVCKRISRRTAELGLAGEMQYRAYLEKHPPEWNTLDVLCRVPISRFYRDRKVFDVMSAEILPSLAARAQESESAVKCWSAGCASGEEPYTLQILWSEYVQKARNMKVPLHVIATDADQTLLDRAEKGCYPAGSLRHLPPELLGDAFEKPEEQTFCIRNYYKEHIEFLCQDIRKEMPEGPFDLILCRNLAFTYFEETLQKEVLAGILRRLPAGGILMIGTHEELPPYDSHLVPFRETKGIFRKK